MPEEPGPSCDVVDCSHQAAGSYLHLALGRAIQFDVCDAHLSELKAGRQRAVITQRPAADAGEARPALRLPVEDGHP